MLIPLISQAQEARSRNYAAMRLVNVYPVSEQGGKQGTLLLGTPGLSLQKTIGSGPIRAIIELNGEVYLVSGGGLYRYSDSALLGAVASSGTCWIESNGLEVMVLSNGYGYAYNIGTSTFAAISAAGFPANAVSLAYMDGYFIVTVGQQFFISALYNGTSWDALDFASAESSPDDLVVAIADHGQLWLIGNSSAEAWYNSGNNAFPFERIGQTRIEKGAAAGKAVVKMDNSIYFIGNDGIVYRGGGGGIERVSTASVEYDLSQASDIYSCYGFSYQQEGSSFYCLSVPSRSTTWVFDARAGVWHERQSDLNTIQWRANCVCKYGNGWLAGDLSSGKVYKIDHDYYSDDGEEIIRQMVAPVVFGEQARIIHDQLIVDTDPGRGLVSGQGSDPQIILDWSDDGGNTYGNQLQVTLGAIGAYKNRALFNRLGISRGRNYRLTFSEPINFALTGLYVKVRLLPS